MDKLKLVTTLGGFFVAPGFLDLELCKKIRGEIGTSLHKPASVYQGADAAPPHIDEEVRKTSVADVSAATRALLNDRLAALKSNIEEHFQATLDEFDAPSFLLYRPGDYFLPHKDRSATPARVSRRRVSVVVFLNDQTDGPVEGCYSGGSLTFYGLIKDPKALKHGFQLTGRAGLLVAFPSDLMHEVEPVIAGERFTIVSCFLESAS